MSKKILRIKSRFYYYSLLFIGVFTVMFFGRCGNNPSKSTVNNDSLVKVKHDSVTKADSVARAQKELAKLDSVARIDSIKKVDSIANAKKKNKPKQQNPLNPNIIVTDYGIIPDYNTPATKYGVPDNRY
ncbi:MAG: hypothetical protein V2A54_07750 [Bacteroidota bacterium]